jgi:nucleoside-diphosphate-sugar epimerase
MYETVVVTGGSGFVARYTVGELLRQGYRVRATLRSIEREPEIRSASKSFGFGSNAQLEFLEADLTSDRGWDQAVTGATFVLHIASPFPSGPSSLDDLLVPAREGTLRILKFARNAGIKRVVITSSFAAIGYGGQPRDEEYTEADWTDGDNPNLPPYIRSKATAERAAWDWHKAEGGTLELAVVNPVGIFGPVMGPNYSSSPRIIDALLKGKLRVTPHQEFGIVDVRDLAILQILLMTEPRAAGRRFIASSDGIWTIARIGQLLKENLGADARHAAPLELPNWIARILARLVRKIGIDVTELGRQKRISNASARTLGWTPRPGAETLIDTARSLLALRQ